MEKRLIRTALLCCLAAATMAANTARAWDLKLGTNLPPVSLHGFASQGFLYSSDYNYLGDSTRGSFRFAEAGLNASVNPFPRTRISAQTFLYDVGEDVGQYDLVLDYAQAEYTFNDCVGVRAGRIRRPQGIYNSVQDVDLARTFVLLPQGVYDVRWRDFYVSLDGGEFFGTIPLNNAGSLSYEVFGGMDNVSMNGGIAQLVRNSLGSIGRINSIDPEPHSGMQLWWNTPVNGLRVGAAGGYKFGFSIDATVQTPFGPVHDNTPQDIAYFQGSLEYLWKSWTFQTEYYVFQRGSDHGQTTSGDSWYVSAAYRFNKWLETGTYYNEYYSDTSQRNNSLMYQKDAALAFRFDLKDWWIVKIEGHWIHGTGLLQDNASNPVQRDNGWFMMAMKTTFSF